MIRISTKIKVACGYVLLILLLVFSVQYIYHKMQLLTKTNVYEEMLNRQRHATNQIIVNLYQAEILSQAFSYGQLDLYDRYVHSMQAAISGVDTLRTLIKDKKQLIGIDSVALLLNRKKENMFSLLEMLRTNSTDKLYQQYIKRLEKRQKDLSYKQPITKTMVTHSNVYTIRKKPKNIFKRIATLFSSGKGDTTKIEKITHEVKTDTIKKVYNPSHTVARLLKNVQNDVSTKRQHSLESVRQKIETLRVNSTLLSEQINKMLLTIDYKEQLLLARQSNKENEIRHNSARTIMVISLSAVLLAIAFLFIIWRDITRSNHYRRELEKSKRYAENLLVTREKLMLTITHDIKAPAGSILGYLELLTRIVTDGREKFYIANMKSAALHLLDLVKSLLDFYRLEANKMDENNVAFNPYQLFDEIYMGFEPMAGAKQLKLIADYDRTELSHSFIGDPFRIRQIAENLLTNSIKFTERGSITLKVVFHGNSLSFSVTDTGCGMSDEDQQHIFQEFTRLKSAQGQDGFGLGLPIVMKLIQLLKGSIQLKSEVDKGSCFTVVLPLGRSADTIIKSKEVPSADILAANDVLAQHKILLIDDDRIQLGLTVAMLKQLHFSAVCCEQPTDLIRKLENDKFDVLFTDLQMPAMNGIELLTAIRKLPGVSSNVPVVAITARSDMDEEYLHSKGFAGCLYKPFTLAELQRTLNNILNLKASETVTPLSAEVQENVAYNFASLTAFSDNDPIEALHIIETFIGEMQHDRATIQKALEDNNHSTVALLSHKMIPRFKMLGATKGLPILLVLEKTSDNISTIQKEEKEKILLILHEMDAMIESAGIYKSQFVKRS